MLYNNQLHRLKNTMPESLVIMYIRLQLQKLNSATVIATLSATRNFIHKMKNRPKKKHNSELRNLSAGISQTIEESEESYCLRFTVVLLPVSQEYQQIQ